MEDHLAYWLTVKLILQIIVCVVAYVLWKYLASKPLGQQTVLDMMIQDHIITSIVNNFTSGLIYLKFSDNYSHDMAMTLLAATQCLKSDQQGNIFSTFSRQQVGTQSLCHLKGSYMGKLLTKKIFSTFEFEGFY